MPTDQEPFDHVISAPDGLRLHVGSYGRRDSSRPAVICLPGLARTGADFDALASTLANRTDDPRHVLTVDYRGRGRSQYDNDPRNYNVAVELSDVLAILSAFDIPRCVVIGTSRGGILAMLLAVAKPAALAGVVLNDIGPVIERRGLARIKDYVGKLPQPRDYAEGADILRRLFASQFPKLTPNDWMDFSHRTFKEENGRLIPDYDVRLAETLETVDTDHDLPTLWPQFDALAHVPVMLIRGANSDLLSMETVAAMRARRPDLEFVEIADQGHAPLLTDDGIIQKIGAFVARCR